MSERSDALIEFWFDFSSGYGYFAAQEIDSLALRYGREVLWRPYMLGVAFKQTGARGLSSTPMKGDYARRDWARLSRRLGRQLSLEGPGADAEALAPGGPSQGVAPLEEVECRAILDAIRACDGNRSEAARRLGIDRSTLRRKLREYQLDEAR